MTKASGFLLSFGEVNYLEVQETSALTEIMVFFSRLAIFWYGRKFEFSMGSAQLVLHRFNYDMVVFYNNMH